MKLKIIFHLLLLNCLFSKVYSQSQCDENTISTNPFNPINQKDNTDILKRRLNNYFNWMEPTFPIYSNSFYNNNEPLIKSPFFDSDALYKYTVFKNMYPEDGWELLAIKRG
ncbi:MAG: hypothetical protein NTW25_03010 [Candidatus Kapabacteria bacterium]|nr:hypothetical protein [Candidatus Kapabacteria bacterium]